MPSHTPLSMLTRAALGGLALLLAAACGGSTPAAGPASAPPAATSAPATGRGSCPDIKPGTPGVLPAWCTGTATVSVSVGNISKQLRGGTCTTSAGLLVLNAGVPTTHEFPGPRPDFVAVNTPPQGGSGQDVGATVILDGKFYGDTGRFGGTTSVADAGKTIHFKGSATNGDTATIDVTC